MKKIKKIGFILATFFVVLVTVAIWKYFSNASPLSSTTDKTFQEHVKEKNRANEKKTERAQVESPQIAIGPQAQHSDEAEQKMTKALQNVQKKSRVPTGGLKISPESLLGHLALEGTPWKIWSGVRAVLAEESTAGDVVVAKLSRYDLVEVPATNSTLNNFDRHAPTVVYNSRLKKPGIVTGVITVETDRKDLLIEALESMNAYIENSFDQIQTYYITSQQTKFDLEKLYLNIKALSFVKNIELDILDRDYEKK